jgi:hypothetical protein
MYKGLKIIKISQIFCQKCAKNGKICQKAQFFFAILSKKCQTKPKKSGKNAGSEDGSTKLTVKRLAFFLLS